MTLSLNLEYGFAGIPNFGKVLSVAGGAFVAGFLPGRLAVTLLGLGNGFDPIFYIKNSSRLVFEVNRVLASNPALALTLLFLSLAVAVVVGAALGLILYYPVTKLRAEFLAMVLLAVAELLLLIGRNYPPIVGGTLGIPVPNVFAWAGPNRFLVATLFSFSMAIMVYLLVYSLTSSPLGRLLRAVRDDENAAMAFGKDVTKVRITSFVLSSAIAALAGAVYAFYTAGVNTLAYSRVTWTFWPWVMVILGGAANNLGVVLGTFTFVAVRKLIVRFKYQLGPIIPFDVVWLDMLLLGTALSLILLYRPEGILPERPIKTIGIDQAMKRLGVKAEGRRSRARLAEKLMGLLKRS